jgi:hypothetical protein
LALSRNVGCLAFAALLQATALPARGAAPLVELELPGRKLTGKVVAEARDLFWLIGQDGRVHQLRTNEVKRVEQASPKFNAWPHSVIRNQVARELGSGFESATTRHYVVFARSADQARQFAETFEQVWRSFHHYFSVRQFKIPEPEFPLVAIVFPSAGAFAKYAKQEGVAVSSGLKGYYLTTSNRVALYEGSAARAFAPEASPFESPGCWASIQADLRATMVHEATHQLAFNTGLHPRLGANPKWVVEGLATVFEAPGIRGTVAGGGIKSRLNPERFNWFGSFAKSRRKPRSLEAFLASDEMFEQETLDAYSQAWALTFYLIETRPREYSEYLKVIASRERLAAYTANARVDDFKQAISKDVSLLEAQFLRFMKQPE